MSALGTSIPGRSFEYYRRLIIIIPTVTPLVVIPIIFSIKYVCGCVHNSHAKIWYNTAKIFAFTKERKLYLQGSKKPSNCIIALLLIKALLLLMFSLAIFLNESVVSAHFGCVSGRWDCFAQGRGRTVRIRNCSNLGNFSNDHVHCYRLAFELSTAISEVGGLVFVLKIVITAYVMMYFSVRFVKNRCLRIATANGVVLLFFLLSVGGPVSFAVGHVRLTDAETLTFQMHNIINATYYAMLYFVVTLPMLLHSKCTFDDFPEYSSNTTVITVGAPMAGENGSVPAVGGATMPPRASVQIQHGDKSHTINVI